MTPKELKSVLEKLTSEEFKDFRSRFGGSYKNPTEFTSLFTSHPEWETKLCDILNLSTEEEKKTGALLSSADSAKRSANAAEQSLRDARRAGRWAIVSTVAAVISSIAAVFVLCRACTKENVELEQEAKQSPAGTVLRAASDE